jgi:hypothetical protein
MWLSRLKARAEAVRTRAQNLSIPLDEDALRVNVLSTSRAKLAAVWEERRRLLPDTAHHGLLSIAERTTITEEDLIVLLSAAIGLFRSCDAIVEEGRGLAQSNGVPAFDLEAARAHAVLPRLEVMRAVNDRIAGFARCPYPALNDWADQFRVERRMPLARALVLLAVPASEWQEPQKQQYVSQILDFFEKQIFTSVMRGPLVRMTIGKSTARVDLCELGTERIPAAVVLDHLLQRNQQSISLDPAAFAVPGTAEDRLHSLSRHTVLYKRDTGIDGMYLGFPFLLARDTKASTKTRIAPLLLWPVRIHVELGNRRLASLAFDNDREEVRLNPAFEALIGVEAAKRWRKTADEMLSRSTLLTAEVMDAFGMLAQPRARTLRSLPGPSTELPPRTEELECSAVLFHVTFIGQAIGEDLRQLKSLPPAGTGLRRRCDSTERANPVPHPQARHLKFPGSSTVSSPCRATPRRKRRCCRQGTPPDWWLRARLAPARARPSSIWLEMPSGGGKAC